MTKEQRKAQEAINSKVIAFMQENNDEIYSKQGKAKRLRNCNAIVYETDNLYVLQSYETIIACIDKENNVMYDFLRYVYEFTRSSAQQISKFNHDYSKSKWGVDKTFRYYPI